MNIEDFFIGKYEELEKANAELSNKVEILAEENHRLKNPGKYGIRCQNTERHAVKVRVESYWSTFDSQYGSKLRSYTPEKLREMLESGIQAFIAKGVVVVSKEKFIGNVTVTGLENSVTKWVREDLGDLYDIFEDGDYAISTDEELLNVWLDDSLEEKAIAVAMEEVASMVEKRIKELESGECDE